MSWRTLIAAVGTVAVSGCFVGPDYHPAATDVPAVWSSQAPSGLTEQVSAASSWWTSFNDPELDSLIQRATQRNLDLHVADARLRQARSARAISAADFWPTLDAKGSYARAKQSQNQPLIGSLPLPPNFPFEYSVYNVGFDASREIDLFGGKRRALEAANAQWQAAVEARNDVMLSMLAEVARNYVELRGGRRRLEIAGQNLKLQQEDLDLTRSRYQGGIATELDVTRAAALLAGVQASMPSLEIAVRGAMYGIAVLLGQEPGDLVAELSPPVAVCRHPRRSPSGCPPICCAVVRTCARPNGNSQPRRPGSGRLNWIGFQNSPSPAMPDLKASVQAPGFTLVVCSGRSVRACNGGRSISAGCARKYKLRPRYRRPHWLHTRRPCW